MMEKKGVMLSLLKADTKSISVTRGMGEIWYLALKGSYLILVGICVSIGEGNSSNFGACQ